MENSTAANNGPWYFTATFLKKAVVLLSILLSAVALILGAFASLDYPSSSRLRALTVSSIIVNAISISLSAVTSLDWQKQSTHEKKFANMLAQTAHLHVERMSDGQANVVITNKYGIGISGTPSSKELDMVGEEQRHGEKKST